MTVKTSDAALANAAGQGINIALGNQRNFSWSSVAGAAVEAGVSDELQDPNSIDAGNLVNSTTGGNLAYSSAVGLISGATAQGAQVLLSGHGQIQFASIAANSFGQALGSSLVGQLQSTPGETQASAVATTTAIAPLGGDAGQPFAALPQIPSYADTSAEAVPTPDQSEAQPQGTIALGVDPDNTDGIGGDGTLLKNIGYNGNKLIVGGDTSGLATDAYSEKVTSQYDAPRPNNSDGLETAHSGIDIVPMNSDGTVDKTAAILSISDGTVVKVGYASGFGNNTVVVQNQDGDYITYGHMSSATVAEEDVVSVGDQVGVVGTEGQSSGIHIHIQESVGGPFAKSPGFQYFVDPGSH
jgi:murein DD-endopeptidase MepM/ murein hydrolase activator NlpD